MAAQTLGCRAGEYQYDRAEVQNGGDFDKDVNDQDQAGEDRPRRRPETPFQKLRHRVEAVAEIEGQENPQQCVQTQQDRPAHSMVIATKPRE